MLYSHSHQMVTRSVTPSL